MGVRGLLSGVTTRGSEGITNQRGLPIKSVDKGEVRGLPIKSADKGD